MFPSGGFIKFAGLEGLLVWLLAKKPSFEVIQQRLDDARLRCKLPSQCSAWESPALAPDDA
jgi:hypothetical protein